MNLSEQNIGREPFLTQPEIYLLIAGAVSSVPIMILWMPAWGIIIGAVWCAPVLLVGHIRRIVAIQKQNSELNNYFEQLQKSFSDKTNRYEQVIKDLEEKRKRSEQQRHLAGLALARLTNYISGMRQFGYDKNLQGIYNIVDQAHQQVTPNETDRIVQLHQAEQMNQISDKDPNDNVVDMNGKGIVT